MISTRRISSVLAVAAAFSCLGASAQAVATTSPLGPPINPVTELDALATTGIPQESKAQFPGIAGQLGGLDRLNEVNQLHQLTDLAAPVTGVLPAVS
ncbi:hypothetical protein [Streptomyces sp. NBC_00691]|uniref:hypothetical protein n=1 Tax=Streptomyces sp. NBC_00691 TaxID=2903671 RepID=UPI002E3359A2|nr:hypothetical protein [Streptomyces sp. NBC_00691]